MYEKLHLHEFDGITNKVFMHEHKYAGTSSKNPDFDGHTHYFSGYVEDVKDHIHYYSLITGSGIKVEGGHVHYYQCFTTFNKRHYHIMWGYSSIYSDY
ncbi:MAG: YmaF family protein [Lutispora sp.]|nr:YmaF family protein [Lutispora sp.]MDD4835046.1 YmaF family protein [Lutispora sp.]